VQSMDNVTLVKVSRCFKQGFIQQEFNKELI
jgi:hypothetical protein